MFQSCIVLCWWSSDYLNLCFLDRWDQRLISIESQHLELLAILRVGAWAKNTLWVHPCLSISLFSCDPGKPHDLRSLLEHTVGAHCWNNQNWGHCWHMLKQWQWMTLLKQWPSVTLLQQWPWIPLLPLMQLLDLFPWLPCWHHLWCRMKNNFGVSVYYQECTFTIFLFQFLWHVDLKLSPVSMVAALTSIFFVTVWMTVETDQMKSLANFPSITFARICVILGNLFAVHMKMQHYVFP